MFSIQPLRWEVLLGNVGGGGMGNESCFPPGFVGSVLHFLSNNSRTRWAADLNNKYDGF